MLRIFFLILFPAFVSAQTKMDTAAIKSELEIIFNRDQKIRKGDSTQFGNYVDSTNLVRVTFLIDKYGWMGRSVIGNRGNYTLWLVIQHAPLKAQEKYLPLMQASVKKGESRAMELACLKDRVLMYKGEKQIYGTQVRINNKTGAQELWPVENEKDVNVRRKEVGLEPLEEYLKHFGIEYKLPD